MCHRIQGAAWFRAPEPPHRRRCRPERLLAEQREILRASFGEWDGVVDGDGLTDSVCDRLLRDFTDIERTIYGISDDRPTCGD